MSSNVKEVEKEKPDPKPKVTRVTQDPNTNVSVQGLTSYNDSMVENYSTKDQIINQSLDDNQLIIAVSAFESDPLKNISINNKMALKQQTVISQLGSDSNGKVHIGQKPTIPMLSVGALEDLNHSVSRNEGKFDTAKENEVSDLRVKSFNTYIDNQPLSNMD